MTEFCYHNIVLKFVFSFAAPPLLQWTGSVAKANLFNVLKFLARFAIKTVSVAVSRALSGARLSEMYKDHEGPIVVQAHRVSFVSVAIYVNM